MHIGQLIKKNKYINIIYILEKKMEQSKQKKLCEYYRYGECRYGKKCRYLHDDLRKYHKLEVLRNCGLY